MKQIESALWDDINQCLRYGFVDYVYDGEEI